MFSEAFHDRTIQALSVFLGLSVMLSFFVPDWVVNQFMFGYARAIAVIGLLVLWRTGLVSFGHALYFGLGAYSAALVEQYFGVTDLFFRLTAAIITSGGVGFFLGFILRKYRDIFFAMLSLAFSMVFYGILVKTEILGSTDGFSVSATTFFGILPETKHALFAAICGFALICAVLVQVYLNSTLGRLTTAIRDNEIRVEYLGYSVARAIHIKYVISAILAGIGGAFMAMAIGQVDPDSMVNWTASGELIFITIFSGPGSVIAPFIGSVVFEFLRTFAFEWAENAWQMIVGGTLLATILFLPGGIWSLLEKIFRLKKVKS